MRNLIDGINNRLVKERIGELDYKLKINFLE